jgi:hypothetical protein
MTSTNTICLLHLTFRLLFILKTFLYLLKIQLQRDLAFNNDGTKMFIVGDTGDDVNEYTLSTGFDVSTASYSQNFSISAQETSPQE